MFSICYVDIVSRIGLYVRASIPGAVITTGEIEMKKAVDVQITKSMMLALWSEVVEAERNAKNIRAHVAALLKAHGIKAPKG